MTCVEVPYSIACALPTLTVIDITNEVSQSSSRESGHSDGIAYVSPRRRASALVRVQERETGFFDDLEELLDPARARRTRASASGCSACCSARATEQIPFADGDLCLGQWQRILLLGFDRPSQRALER